MNSNFLKMEIESSKKKVTIESSSIGKSPDSLCFHIIEEEDEHLDEKD